MKIFFTILILLCATLARPATYYVDQSATGAANGTSWTDAWVDVTSAVSSVAAGDTVYVRPGTYTNRVTVTADGTSGSPIRWVASGTRSQIKTVGWYFNSADWNWLIGFDISHTNASGTQNYHAVRFESLAGGGVVDCAIHDTESDSNGGVACLKTTDVTVRGNDIWNTVYGAAPLYTSQGAAGIFFGTSSNPATNCVSEYNWTSYLSDHHNTYGPGNRILNCIMGPVDSTTEAHVDGWQPNAVTLDMEMSHCTQLDSQDPGGEGVHFALTSAEASRGIVRGGIIVNGVGELAIGDGSTNFFVYHLTFVNAQYASSFQNLVNESATCIARNNLWHTINHANPVVHTTASGGSADFDYEVVFPSSSGYSKPNSPETDPSLVSTNNASPDFRIGSSGSARNAAGGLTQASGSGSTSTSLSVSNYAAFVIGDWVYVGSAGPSKITARSAGTGNAGTYTLSSALSWSEGDPVYWSTPSGVRYADIGAFPYSANLTNRTASYTVNGTSVTVTANFESRMAIVYDTNGIPSEPILAPTNYTFTASSGVSKVRVYPWLAQYSADQRWVDATAGAITLNVGTANVGTINIVP